MFRASALPVEAPSTACRLYQSESGCYSLGSFRSAASTAVSPVGVERMELYVAFAAFDVIGTVIVNF